VLIAKSYRVSDKAPGLIVFETNTGAVIERVTGNRRPADWDSRGIGTARSQVSLPMATACNSLRSIADANAFALISCIL
jgi:hypothetical protein